MNEINLEQYNAELQKLENGPAIEVKMPPLAAVAIVRYIQLGCNIPETKLDPLNKIAIEAAKDIQSLFNQNSATYKLLETGWNPQHDRRIKHEQ